MLALDEHRTCPQTKDPPRFPVNHQNGKLQDNLTLAGAPAFDAQRQERPKILPFSKSGRCLVTGHLPCRNIPAFPCPTGYFGKTKSGTDFGKVAPLGASREYFRPAFSLYVRWRESLINQIAYARPSALVHVPQVLDGRRSALSPWTIDPLSVGQEGRDPLLAL